MNSAPLNILVVHVAGLSETTLALPSLRALRGHFAGSQICIAASAAAADLLRLGQCADLVLPVARLRREMLSPALFYRSLRAIRTLRESQFDLAIELHSSPESAFILQMAHVRERLSASASKSKKGLRPVLEKIASSLARRPAPQMHLAHRYLKQLEPLGVRPTEAEPRLRTDREADARADTWMEKSGVDFGDLLVGIHPGAGPGTERWPLERFASIAARMIHNFNARIIVFGGPYESGLARRLKKMLPERRSLVLQSPKMEDLVSTLARLSLLVANHSGPAHVAAAVGTPVVVASTLTGLSTTDLLSKNHISVRYSSAALIPEEEVYDAACRLIKLNRASVLSAL